MSESSVYFADLRASSKENLLDKIGRLIDMVDLKSIIRPRSLVAVKLHFGEKEIQHLSGPILSAK